VKKFANFDLPHLNLAPSFEKIFDIRILESLGYHVALFASSYV